MGSIGSYFELSNYFIVKFSVYNLYCMFQAAATASSQVKKSAAAEDEEMDPTVHKFNFTNSECFYFTFLRSYP